MQKLASPQGDFHCHYNTEMTLCMICDFTTKLQDTVGLSLSITQSLAARVSFTAFLHYLDCATGLDQNNKWLQVSYYTVAVRKVLELIWSLLFLIYYFRVIPNLVTCILIFCVVYKKHFSSCNWQFSCPSWPEIMWWHAVRTHFSILVHSQSFLLMETKTSSLSQVL